MSTGEEESGSVWPSRPASSQAEVRSRYEQALGSRDQNKQGERGRVQNPDREADNKI